jgi:hypothetical protein
MPRMPRISSLAALEACAIAHLEGAFRSSRKILCDSLPWQALLFLQFNQKLVVLRQESGWPGRFPSAGPFLRGLLGMLAAIFVFIM